MIVFSKRLASQWLLSLFSFYLITGNVFRVISVSCVRFEHNLLFTEFVFFLFCSLFISDVRVSLSVLASLGAIALSAVYGTLIHGLDVQAMLFSGRLIFQILSGIIIGEILFMKFGTSLHGFLKYFDGIYLKNILLGFVIYILFYRAGDLWILLSQIGICFDGDGHVGRFVSPYFDPNYFGVICSIPFIIRYHIHQEEPNFKLFLAPLAILLTWSRSGISTFFLVGSFLVFCRMSGRLRWLISSRKVLWAGACLVACSAILLGVSEQSSYFFNRFFHMGEDPSALGRIVSFAQGLQILSDRPLLGVGYNYLTIYLRDSTGHSGLDSSLLSLAVNFGIPACLLFFLWLTLWLFNMIRRARVHKFENRVFYSFLNTMVFYLAVCIVFSCQFNNLLFYQFWLIPVVAIFSYFRCYLKAVKLAISSDVC